MPHHPSTPALASENVPLRIAINGFGRIGRNVLRVYLANLIRFYENSATFSQVDFIQAAFSQEILPQKKAVNTGSRGIFSTFPIEIVAINDIGELSALLHLLKYDSTHGRLSDTIRLTLENNTLVISIDTATKNPATHSVTQRIEFFQHADPAQLPWHSLNVDVVLECTGHFRQYRQAYQHITAGAKQVIVGAAPFDEVDACIVMGVNSDELTRDVAVISSVSCTTQALVPMVKLIHDNFGIMSAMVTEIHAVTADQTVLDQVHRDLRRARASGHNIIPTTSSSIAATVRVLPQMAGKIEGFSIRVPTIDVAAIDVTFVCETTPDIATLNALLRHASQSQYQGIMGYSDEPLVSSDFIGQPESLVIDSLQTMQVGNQIKLFAWYDNEWGYANRLIDMCLWLAANP